MSPEHASEILVDNTGGASNCPDCGRGPASIVNEWWVAYPCGRWFPTDGNLLTAWDHDSRSRPFHDGVRHGLRLAGVS